MALNADNFQARHDRALRKQLLADNGVIRAIAMVDEMSTGFGFIQRRRLLAGALRVTRAMAPQVADAMAACRETLGIKQPIEVYVRPDPMFNAFCLKNPGGPLNIAFSSRMIESFSPAELRFVLGHELGHALLDHFKIPMPLTAQIRDVAGTIVSRTTALQLFYWCRAAEISADRIGMLCARERDAVSSAFFKLSSGLAVVPGKADLSQLIAQMNSVESAPSARPEVRDDDVSLDCFSTHPFSPVRLRSMHAFAESKLCANAVGGSGCLSDDELEQIVERSLAVMEPTYLEEKSVRSDQLRRLLYCAGLSIAAANGEVSTDELSALRALLGTGQVNERFKLDDIRKELETLLDKVVKDVPALNRAQVVQHLTIIATADSDVHDAELREMQRIAFRLGVDPAVVDQTIAASTMPLD